MKTDKGEWKPVGVHDGIWRDMKANGGRFPENTIVLQAWSCLINLVPRVFSLSNMAAAGEKTLAHSRKHVTGLSTESGNLFKMAAKIKTERIWVRRLETGEKQTKWRQRQTQKKLKIWKNALTSHRNTVEWYSDLILCSMTFICFKPERSSVHGT